MQIRFGIAISALAISEKFHTRAPGPPETMAVATPTIFPVPMVAASAVVSAEKGIHLPVRGSWCGLPCWVCFQCIAKVTPCKKSGAHSQEDTGSDQQDQHHRSPDKVINSGNNFFIKYFEDLQSWISVAADNGIDFLLPLTHWTFCRWIGMIVRYIFGVKIEYTGREATLSTLLNMAAIPLIVPP